MTRFYYLRQTIKLWKRGVLRWVRSFLWGPLLLSFAFAFGVQAQQSTNLSSPGTTQHGDAAASTKSQTGVPQSIQSHAQLNAAEALVQRGDFQNAERSVRAYLSHHADSANGHFLLGYILYRIDKPQDSLEEYTLGARTRTPSADDLAAVAMDYVLLHDYADADKWLTRATASKPENALYWYYLGRTKYNENRFQEAIDAFNKSLQLHPRYIRAQYNLGLAYAGLMRYDQAKTAYETAIAWQQSTTHPDPQPYLDLGMLLTEQGAPGQAVPNLQKAVELDEHNPKMHEELGHAYAQLHDLKKAQIELESALLLAPNIPSLHFELGRIYQKENMKAQAKSEFARCAALNGTTSTDFAETPNPDSHK